MEMNPLKHGLMAIPFVANACAQSQIRESTLFFFIEPNQKCVNNKLFIFLFGCYHLIFVFFFCFFARSMHTSAVARTAPYIT